MNRQRGQKRSAAAAMAVMTFCKSALDEAGAFAAAAASQRRGGDADAIETPHLGTQIAQQCAHIRGEVRQRLHGHNISSRLH
jgi:hypothetical protein